MCGPDALSEEDLVRLRHMLDAARTAIRSTAGRGATDLAREPVWALGLVKCVEIIGEAAGRIATSTTDRLVDIPWRQIVGMRNRLVHAYYDIDQEQVWRTVKEDLPRLVEQLEAILE